MNATADPPLRLILADALDVLSCRVGMFDAVFTGLPDAAEIGMTPDQWRPWYRRAMHATLSSIARGGVGVVYATDRRADGGIESKASVVLGEARAVGLRVLWHKVVVVTMGTSLYRPSYSHLIAVSRDSKVTAGKATPDVIEGGPKDYPNSLGSNAIRVGLDLIERFHPAEVVDPFVGRGSILAAAADRGLRGLGVEIDPEQIALALAHHGDRAVQVSLDDYLWGQPTPDAGSGG